jgi:hypothetical protein
VTSAERKGAGGGVPKAHDTRNAEQRLSEDERLSYQSNVSLLIHVPIVWSKRAKADKQRVNRLSKQIAKDEQHVSSLTSHKCLQELNNTFQYTENILEIER